MSDKIIFVIPDMPGGGTERVVALLANEYAARGIETSVLLFAGHQTAYPLGDKVEVVSLGEPSGGSIAKRILQEEQRLPHMGIQCHGSSVFCGCRVRPQERIPIPDLGEE